MQVQPWSTLADHETLIVQKHFDGCSTWFLKELLNNVAVKKLLDARFYMLPVSLVNWKNEALKKIKCLKNAYSV